MALQLTVVELIRLGGHRVLATEPVALELERMGHARLCDREPGEQREAMRHAGRAPMDVFSSVRELGQIG